MLTKIAHTAGPWVVDSGMVMTPVGTPIAHMDRVAGNGTYGAERDMNARLIAAAPELLEALEILIDEMERKYVPYGVDGLPDCWNRLMTVARKARGDE